MSILKRNPIVIRPWESVPRSPMKKGGSIWALTFIARGKPKKPMKEFCELMIGHIEMWFPLKQPMDLAWASSVLGVLMRDYYPGKYRDVI